VTGGYVGLLTSEAGPRRRTPRVRTISM
jgi:hypothetical protein